MRVVYKWLLPNPRKTEVVYDHGMPPGPPKPLYVAEQGEQPYVWMEHTWADDGTPNGQHVRLHLIGTGINVPPNHEYLGTILYNEFGFVAHWYMERVSQ